MGTTSIASSLVGQSVKDLWGFAFFLPPSSVPKRTLLELAGGLLQGGTPAPGGDTHDGVLLGLLGGVLTSLPPLSTPQMLPLCVSCFLLMAKQVCATLHRRSGN